MIFTNVVSTSVTTVFCKFLPNSVVNIFAFLFISPFTLSATSAFAINIPFSIASSRSGDTEVPTPNIHSLDLFLPNLVVPHSFFSE